jgi:hypothetical protein
VRTWRAGHNNSKRLHSGKKKLLKTPQTEEKVIHFSLFFFLKKETKQVSEKQQLN